MEQMPMWCPPTPPQQDTDVYIDHTMGFLYDMEVMTESQLPPVYVKKEANKRSRLDAGLVDSRRALKIPRKDDSSIYAPRSLFERPSPALVKMRRDLKLQKYRGLMRPPVTVTGVKLALPKPSVDPPCFHNWTIHEDMALLKAVQNYQGLPLNLVVILAGHTPNWDFVSDYVNTVSITYRSPKQCRHRYESVVIAREEGKQVFDASPRKKKNKSGVFNKFPLQTKANRPMRTAQLFSQDNNQNFSQVMIVRFDALKGMSNKRSNSTKTVVNNPLTKNPKHMAVLTECGIDIEHPVLPVVVAARRAERVAREKKNTEQQHLAQRYQMVKVNAASANTNQTVPISNTSTPQSISSPVSQVVLTQTTTAVTTVTASVVTSQSTATSQLRTQRILASPLQGSTVVSVSGLTPAQLQAATQRLIVSPAKTVVGTAAAVGKTISPAQLQMIKQASLKQQQFRLQAGGVTGQNMKATTVSLAGQTAVQVQFTQGQPRTQYVKQANVAGQKGITRTVTESEMAQLLKRQQLQQQKVLTAAVSGGSSTVSTTIQNLSPQVFAQAIQAGTSGTQVATLVKTVSSSGVTQTVTIPVTGVTLGTAVKALTPGIKGSSPQHIQQLRIQQQLIAQKKLNQKIANITQVAKSGGVATQLIVGSKPLPTAMTIQQFQHVVRSPLSVSQGPVVLAKGPSRVIPVNTGQGNKPTIQVVSATSQGLTTAIRPQVSSTLQGALAGIKVQGATGSQTQQALLSQVSAALQSQNLGLRQSSSPVRIQTASGTPLVAVSMPTSNVQQASSSTQSANTERSNDQVSKFVKK